MFNLHTEPALPAAGTTFLLSLRAPECHVFWADDPTDREVEVTGSTVRVIVEYTAPAFNGGCDAQTTRTVFWSMGPLAEGAYVLQFAGNDPIGGGLREIEQIPLTVVAPLTSPPRVVPVNGMWALLLLGLSFAAFAWSALRLRH